MGLLHSHPKKVSRQVKPSQNGCNRCAQRRVFGKKSINYVHNSYGETHREANGILPWWENLFSLLSPSKDIQSSDGTSTPETQYLDSSLSPIDSTYGSYCNTTLSPMVNHHQPNIVNEYLNVRCNPNQHRLTNTDSHSLGLSDLGNDSYNDQINDAYCQQLTEIDNNRSTRWSPHSAHAISEQKRIYTCIKSPEPEEISIAQAEVMYRQATWRMYERITLSRAAAAVTNQRFCIPNVLHESDGSCGCSPTSEKSSEEQRAYLRYSDTKYAETGSNLEEGFQNDPILGSSLSVDRHHICFDMDHD